MKEAEGQQEGFNLVSASSLSTGMKCDIGDIHEEHDQAGGLKTLQELAFDQTKEK